LSEVDSPPPITPHLRLYSADRLSRWESDYTLKHMLKEMLR